MSLLSPILLRLRLVLEMIKFSHSLFALPFALIGALLAVRVSGQWPTAGQLVWIGLAMVGGRSGAMALNRLIDADIDAANPRTADRHLPTGKVSRHTAWLLTFWSFALLLLAAARLNRLCLVLAPLVMALFVLYPFCKRFTAWSHLVLGACLGAAPVGAWIALRGDVYWPVVTLGLAVLLWVAGFDIFYALQDEDFDRRYGLFSLPVLLGSSRALDLARLFHAAMVVLLVLAGWGGGLGFWYLSGVAVVAGLLAWEHHLVRPHDLSRLNLAFFNLNGLVSVLLLLFTLVDVLNMRHP